MLFFTIAEAEDTVLLVDQNCTPPAVDDFPPDGLTQAQRRQGYVLIHLLVSAYMFYMLAKVCDDYFVPCIECICDGKLQKSIVHSTTKLTDLPACNISLIVYKSIFTL